MTVPSFSATRPDPGDVKDPVVVEETGQAVGAITPQLPSINPDHRLFMRIDLSDKNRQEPIFDRLKRLIFSDMVKFFTRPSDALHVGLAHENREETIRKQLNRITAIDIVADPLGVFHEAVPYENLVVVGPRALADSLSLILPAFFAPLAYRKLEFSIQSVPAPNGETALLFGTLFDTRPTPPCGNVRWITNEGDEQGHLPKAPDGRDEEPMRWRRGQGHGLIAFSEEFAGAAGLPYLPKDRLPENHLPKDGALVIEPGSHVPRVRLATLSNPKEGPSINKQARVMLEPYEEAVVRVVKEGGFYEGCYEARFHSREDLVRLIPDSAYSRPTPVRNKASDMLEVLGLFLPDHGDGRDVKGIAVGFTGERLLRSDGLRTSEFEVCLVDRSERVVRYVSGTLDPIGRDGDILRGSLRLLPASDLDRSKDSRRRREWALITTNDDPLVWIPLRLGPSESADPIRVTRSQLRYARTRWIDPNETTPDAAAIYLDWLDTAVRIVRTNPSAEATTVGLASYLNGGVGNNHCFLRHSGRAIQIVDGKRSPVDIHEEQPFRFGPLWVQLRSRVEEPRDETGSTP